MTTSPNSAVAAATTVAELVKVAGSVEEAKSKTAKLAGEKDAAMAAHQNLDEETSAAAVVAKALEAVQSGAVMGKIETSNRNEDITTTDNMAHKRPEGWPAPFYLEAGLRRVEPYYYTYKTWVKERWRGRGLLEVFESEFRDRPLAYYRRAIDAGLVMVNDKVVGPDHVLLNGQRIFHSIHRHEPPVTADAVGIIHEDADMVVINKPAGIPVHPAGRYRFNSVVEVLKAQRGPGFVPYPCNRLDRLTSGIMFLAKSPATAKRLSLQIQARVVRKEYLARVVGRFPDGVVVCDQPILQISPKLGLNRVRASGRAARTVFQRLAYYGGEGAGEQDRGGYSIVRCMPVTGRTHQIRVHLQFLGYPIENDPIYANQKVWGMELGRGDADATHNTDESVISRLARMGKDDVADAVAYYDEMVDEYHKRKAEKMSGETCALCDTPLYTDPGEHELSLWLHSLRYEAADGSWRYVSPMPAWALPPAGTEGPTQVGQLDALVEAAVAAGVVEDEEPDEEGAAETGRKAKPEARPKKIKINKGGGSRREEMMAKKAAAKEARENGGGIATVSSLEEKTASDEKGASTGEPMETTASSEQKETACSEETAAASGIDTAEESTSRVAEAAKGIQNGAKG